MLFSFHSKPKRPLGNSSAAGSTLSMPCMQSDRDTLTSLGSSITQTRETRSFSNMGPNVTVQEFPKGRPGCAHRPSLPVLVYSSAIGSVESLSSHSPSSNAHFGRRRYATQGSPISVRAAATTANQLPSRFNTIEQASGIRTETTEIGAPRSPSSASPSIVILPPMQEELQSTSWNKYTLSNHSNATTLATFSGTDTSDRETAPRDRQVHTLKPRTALSLAPFPKNDPFYSRGNSDESPPPAYSTLPTIKTFEFTTPPPSDLKASAVRQSFPVRPRHV
jgi:hypothetical protein